MHDASDVLVKKIAIKNSYLEVEDMGGKWVGGWGGVNSKSDKVLVLWPT